MSTSPKSKSELSPTTEERTTLSRRLALVAAEGGLDKKAVGIEIIDVIGKVDYADFLVLMTGTSNRHCAAIAGGVEEALAKVGQKALSVEGLSQGEWVLLDYFDVVVHVFSDDARGLYDLSGLWMDAGRVPVPSRPNEPPSPRFD